MDRVFAFFDDVDAWLFHLHQQRELGQDEGTLVEFCPAPVYISLSYVVSETSRDTSNLFLQAAQEDPMTGHILCLMIPVGWHNSHKPSYEDKKKIERRGDWLWKRLIAKVNLTGNFCIRNALIAMRPLGSNYLWAKIPDQWLKDMQEEISDYENTLRQK